MSKKSKLKASKKAAKLHKPVPPVNTMPWWRDDNRLYIILAILAITFISFSPSLNSDFVNWDDDRNFYENELITTLTADNFWSNTKKIFTTDVIGNYNPLSIWSFAVDKMVYGLDSPRGWHMTNILLHLLCVLLVWRLAIQLGLSKAGAVVLTLLFAIHPMRVESVAWVTERKDVLYGFFYLAALTQYIKYRDRKTTRRMLWIVALFVLALFSKIQAVILPLSMLCIDYLLDGKISIKGIWSKWYYFMMSLAFGILGIYMLSSQGSLEANDSLPHFQRIFIGSYSLVVYFIKLLIPYELSPLYPYPSAITWEYYASIIIVPILLYTLYRAYRQGIRPLVFGLCFFLVNIFFLLQILGAGQGFLADRFTYIAYIGLFYIIAWAADTVLDRYHDKKSVVMGGMGVYLALFAGMTYIQCKVWTNSDTLWSHVLKYYDKTTLPYGNRANYLRDQGQTMRALSDYNSAIALKEQNPQAYNSRGKLFFNLANTRDTLLLALSDYDRAIYHAPDNGEFYVNRGATYARLGDIDNAIKDIDQGIALKPNHAVGYLNRSVLHNQKGDMAKALADINTYLELRPFHADMWYEKGRAMRQVDQVRPSISAFSRAIQINNTKGLYYYERARTYASLGDIPKAKQDLATAIARGFTEIDPGFKREMGM